MPMPWAKAKASDSKADSAASQWDRKVTSAFSLAQKEWKQAKQKLQDAVANKDPSQDANKDPSQDDQAAKARRLAYHKQLEQTSLTLLAVLDAAQNTKDASVDSILFLRIIQIREHIASTYMTCEKYGEAKEQYLAAMRGWNKSKLLINMTNVKGGKPDRLATCRRGIALATSRGARSSDEPQKARLQALKLVMQNINGDAHDSLGNDIKVCDDIIFHLVAATYPPPGSGEDSYQACQAHMETLRQATAELKISKDKPTAVVSVFALRVKVRELEILANDMGDLDRVKSLHGELKQSETRLSQDNSIDEKYRDIAKRLFSESDKIEAKAEIRRKTVQKWSRPPAQSPDPESPDSAPQFALSRNNTAGTDFSFTSVDDNYNSQHFLETGADGLYGVLADEKQRKHWHENWLKRLEEFSRTTLKKTSGIGKLGVRLTVIDTGVHAKHPQLDRQWKGHFRDFSKLTPLKGSSCEQSHGDEIDPIDEDGHGTFIAGLILRLVPDVDLYVARVGIRRDDMATDENLAYKIGRAIHYAVNIWKTEIISISIGCQGTKSARDSLREAIRKDVIVLAATGNFGDSLSPAFPNNEDRVFKIYSASLRAKPEESSATPTDPKYSFHSLGKDIPSTWPGQLVPKLGPDVFYRCKTRERDEKKGKATSHVCSDKCRTYAAMSGTSFSAPIVAAMVAIIYQFYNTYSSKMDPCIREEAEGLKTITSIRHILTKMSTRTAGPLSGIHYLSAPTYRSGSDFFFEPDKRYSAKDEAPVAGETPAPRRPRDDDQNEWKQTYDEFMWRRLVQTINDGRRGG
ncbi:hypothetical protein CDD82_7503 [Ophiocordyceps australis]|uniref:Peptidase S8/S53 domain-containing protein n=1 Tax=Ophiocordyceps australis TaxID=1399860 RepID=A0A2C5XET4_9HYPO|nr:hypothetical protein CDD82_7503 [Ophiocordyceps australis]